MTEETSKRDGVAREMEGAAGVGLLKEWTLAVIQHRQTMQAFQDLLVGDEESEGLLDVASGIRNHLDTVNAMLSRFSFVFDRLIEIKRGDAKAEPLVEPRAPELDDVAAALEEWDRRLAEAQEEVEREEAAEEEAPEESAEEGDGSAPMFTQGPSVAKQLPPLPVVPKPK